MLKVGDSEFKHLMTYSGELKAVHDSFVAINSYRPGPGREYLKVSP